MTRAQQLVIDVWLVSILRAVELGESNAAYKLTRGLVGRCREMFPFPPEPSAGRSK